MGAYTRACNVRHTYVYTPLPHRAGSPAVLVLPPVTDYWELSFPYPSSFLGYAAKHSVATAGSTSPPGRSYPRNDGGAGHRTSVWLRGKALAAGHPFRMNRKAVSSVWRSMLVKGCRRQFCAQNALRAPFDKRRQLHPWQSLRKLAFRRMPPGEGLIVVYRALCCSRRRINQFEVCRVV